LGSYAGGQSEVMMGQAIKKYQWKRNDIVISTKASFQSDCEQIMEDFDVNLVELGRSQRRGPG
jgi:aryl-alcohol dehydrogenase-like predicted oxidoreductase